MTTSAFIQKISVHMYYVQPKRDFYSRELELSDDMVEALDEFNQNQAAYQEWLGICYNTVEGRARSGEPQPEPPAFLTEGVKNVEDKPKAKTTRAARSKQKPDV